MCVLSCLLFSSRRRHTRCALVTGVQTCALPILSHFKDESAVNALLEASELPQDDYIGYALIESFKHLRPVWLEMFKKDPGFLADDPAKAALLCRALLARQEWKLPGFITAEPGSTKYGVSTCSDTEFQKRKGWP